MLKTLALAFLLLICAVCVSAQNTSNLTISLSNITINNGAQTFISLFNCKRSAMQTTYIVTVSTDFDIQAQNGITYKPDLADRAFTLDSAFAFNLNGYGMTTLIIGIQFNFTCAGVDNPDSAVLLIQNLNSTTAPSNLFAQTKKNSFAVTAAYSKKCLSSDQYGFNCNTLCRPNTDDVECYNCANDGSKLCCNDPNIDPNNCRYKSTEPATTSSSKSGGNTSNSSSNEKLYMWIMIGLAIVLFILLVVIVIALFVWCCRQPSKVIVAPAPAPLAQQYMAPPPEQPKPLPPYEYSTYRRPTTPQQSRRNTHTAKPVVTREWDDESLASDWVEPQPRRIAQNAISVSRNNSVRIIEEPLDIIV